MIKLTLEQTIDQEMERLLHVAKVVYSSKEHTEVYPMMFMIIKLSDGSYHSEPAPIEFIQLQATGKREALLAILYRLLKATESAADEFKIVGLVSMAEAWKAVLTPDNELIDDETDLSKSRVQVSAKDHPNKEEVLQITYSGREGSNKIRSFKMIRDASSVRLEEEDPTDIVSLRTIFDATWNSLK